jgi:hypothetical protein
MDYSRTIAKETILVWVKETLAQSMLANCEHSPPSDRTHGTIANANLSMAPRIVTVNFTVECNIFW